jgi:uncharacterized membrane protein
VPDWLERLRWYAAKTLIYSLCAVFFLTLALIEAVLYAYELAVGAVLRLLPDPTRRS